MNRADTERAILSDFAALLDYPRGGEAEAAARCASILAGTHPDAASLLYEAGACLAGTPRGRREEVFTAAFDLQATCAPYVGHHLFGEGYKRRVFLAKLNALYADRAFSAGRELPDHLAVLLRFLAGGEDGEAAAIRGEAIIPALAKMTAAFGESENPYGKVLRALAIVLRAPLPREAADGPGDRSPEEVAAP